MGGAQRSEPEANRLVDWLLFNGIVVEELKQAYTFDGVTYPKGSYVVPMTQAHRGLADTALSVGVDISNDISILYAPPAAWSHGYLWGADVVTRAARRGVRPEHQPDPQGQPPARRRRARLGHRLRAGDRLADGGADAQRADGRGPHGQAGARRPSRRRAAGSCRPAARSSTAGSATKMRLAVDRPGQRRLVLPDHRAPLPATEPIDRKPRILVLTGALNQDVWSLQNLGFTPDFMSTAALNSARHRPAAELRRDLEHRRLPANGGQRDGRARGCRASSRRAVATSVPGPTVPTSSPAARWSPASRPRRGPATAGAASSTGTTWVAPPARSPGLLPARTPRSWTRRRGSPPSRRR